MDPMHYARVAAAGWILLAVIAASSLVVGGQPCQDFKSLFEGLDVDVAVAIWGAVAAVGAPPALGLLLERVAALLLLLSGRNLWKYPLTEVVPSYFSESGWQTENLSAPGSFHVLFYTYADSRLIEWTRRRVNQVYSSVTSIVALFLGLGVSMAIHAFSWLVFFASVAMAVVLGWYARIVEKAVEHTCDAWVRTVGKKAVAEIAAGIRESAQRERPPSGRGSEDVK